LKIKSKVFLKNNFCLSGNGRLEAGEGGP